MGDFVGAIGAGVSGLVGGAISALSVAFDSVVGTLQVMLPGPLFPIAVVAVIVFVFWWLFRK